jgi:hypothetical protein
MGKLVKQFINRNVARRSFMRGVAGAGFYATAPALNLLTSPAKAASNWRGLVG